MDAGLTEREHSLEVVVQPYGELLLPGQFELGPEMEALSRLETEWGILNVPELIALPGLEIEELGAGEYWKFGQRSIAYSTERDPFFGRTREVVHHYNADLTNLAYAANSLLDSGLDDAEVESALRTLVTEFAGNVAQHFAEGNQASLDMQAALEVSLDDAIGILEYIQRELRSRAERRYNAHSSRQAREKLAVDSPVLSRLYRLARSWPPVDTLRTSPTEHPLGAFMLLIPDSFYGVQRPVDIQTFLLWLDKCLEFDDSDTVRTGHDTFGGPLLAVLKYPHSPTEVINTLNECLNRIQSLVGALIEIGREESRDMVAQGACEIMVRVTGFFGSLLDILRRAERLVY